jgi:hypothetical protein
VGPSILTPVTALGGREKGAAMNLSRITLARRLGALALAGILSAMGAATALADPPGQPHRYVAQVRPDDRGGMQSFGFALMGRQPEVGDDISHNSASSATQSVQQVARGRRPDDRAGTRGAAAPAIVSTSAPVAAGSGFDWRDAGVGAGTTLGLILLAGGMVFVGLRRRGHAGPQAPSTPLLHG